MVGPLRRGKNEPLRSRVEGVTPTLVVRPQKNNLFCCVYSVYCIPLYVCFKPVTTDFQKRGPGVYITPSPLLLPGRMTETRIQVVKNIQYNTVVHKHEGTREKSLRPKFFFNILHSLKLRQNLNLSNKVSEAKDEIKLF